MAAPTAPHAWQHHLYHHVWQHPLHHTEDSALPCTQVLYNNVMKGSVAAVDAVQGFLLTCNYQHSAPAFGAKVVPPSQPVA